MKIGKMRRRKRRLENKNRKIGGGRTKNRGPCLYSKRLVKNDALAEGRKQRLLDRKRELLPIDLMQIEFTKSHHYSYFAVNILPFCVDRGASKDNTKIIYLRSLSDLLKMMHRFQILPVLKIR